MMTASEKLVTVSIQAANKTLEAACGTTYQGECK
jgi:hypothetical protein